MDLGGTGQYLLDQLEVGVSIVSWCPEDPESMDWILVNEGRCRIAGFTREEIKANPPFGQVTRETRAQIKVINNEIAKHGQFTIESTMLHKSNKAVPVVIHMKLIEVNGSEALMVEFHDITSFKETEARLKLSRESSAEMLTLIEKEKQSISENFKNNLVLILSPLLDQLRISADSHQQEVLKMMARRIEYVGREIGIVGGLDAAGLNLTKRQILVCEMIRDGMTSKEIAKVLNCSPSTVNNHRNAIRRKLNLSGKSANLQAFLNGAGEGRGTAR
jgi:PAS domain S-box-containing protein